MTFSVDEAATLELARAANEPPTVVLCEPLPAEFFARAVVGRVHTLRCRVSMLRELGARRVVCLRFNRRIAMMSAETFARRILIDGLAVRHVVVGEQFRFGYRRLDSESTLSALSEERGFGVTVVPIS